MYAGHAAVALALKAREPRLPLLPLVLACYGPDWMEVALMFPSKRVGMAIFTHSIPAVVIGALLSSLLYAAFRKPGARWIALGWSSHWLADLITGQKPMLSSVPLIGLDMYRFPAVDFALESVLVAIACVYFARTYAVRAEQRRVVVMMGIMLVLLQGAVDVTLSVIRKPNTPPSVAEFGGRTQLSAPERGDGG